MKKLLLIFSVLFINFAMAKGKTDPIISIDTGHTIQKIELAQDNKETKIIAVSYVGIALSIDSKNKILWETNVSDGIYCNDIWCADITGDNRAEILLAFADGSIHCLDIDGKKLWKFQPNEIPMVSVCTIRQAKGESYVVCGGNDTNMYYVSAKGELMETIKSTSFNSQIKVNAKWNDMTRLVPNTHAVNFVRPIPQADGSDILIVNGITGHADQNSALFQFKPLEKKPFKSHKLGYGYGPVADFKVRKVNGEYLILFGSSGMQDNLFSMSYNPTTDETKKLNTRPVSTKIQNGYRVVQPEVVMIDGKQMIISKFGPHLLTTDTKLTAKSATPYKAKFSFYDICYNEKDNAIILASCQSGGSCVHIIDMDNKSWGKAFVAINPIGKIQTILENSETLQKNIDKFTKPSYQREQIKAYLLDKSAGMEALESKLRREYDTPVFLGSTWAAAAEDWDRAIVKGTVFETARDNRKKYTAKQEDLVANYAASYNENGLAAWGGHGTDPFYYDPETLKKAIDAGKGKKSVWIWPELTILYKKEFQTALDKLFYPFAEYGQKHNAMLNIRTKHAFCLSKFYTPLWTRFMNGDFADILIPSMEETEDKSMDLSLAGRLGIWASGVSDQWGTRCARDNPSFTRNRQYSDQNLPNHFLRNAIFHVSYGATYINNFPITTDYSYHMGMLWEMIAKGVIFIPKREEILSFSPVHLSMTNPDEVFEVESNAGTSIINISSTVEETDKNKFVFDRINGTWSGAKVNPWDFSAYAAGVKDRRQNFLAPYSNGVVLITPPQEGYFAAKGVKRGKLVDKLHPIYKDIMIEFITDGRNYYSADSTKVYKADEYYKVVEKEIKESAKLLPLTVSGDNVAWVLAQSAPRHLRLTLIDGGYLNPDDRVAKVTLNTIDAVKVIDLLDNKVFKVNKSDNTITIDISCGMARFIDIELSEDFPNK